MKKLFSMVSILVLSVAFVSCGKDSKKIVTDIQAETKTQDEQRFVVADFEMELGSAELPFLHLPLPKDYGYLRLYRNNGVNHVAVDVNLTEILKLPQGTDATLPNGTAIPVDAMGAGVVEIPVSGINGKVYVAYNNDVALIGFAMAIKQLDGVGRELGTIGVFPNFTIKDVPVTAGVFASETDGKNGIAAFGNIATLWESSSSLADAHNAFRPVSQYTPYWKERIMGRRLLRIKNIKQKLDISN